MNTLTLPDDDTMYSALTTKDPEYDGIFFTGVRTTGIFCRSICTARKPKRENVTFFPSAREALLAGFRPCRVCHPMTTGGVPPAEFKPLLAEIERDPAVRFSDADLRGRGVDPVGLRRWFKRHHGLTFQAYLRALRIGAAFGQIAHGDRTIDAGFAAGWESTSAFGEAFKKITGTAPSDARGKTLVKVTRVSSPLGPMLAGATDKGICLLEFVDRRMLPTQLTRIQRRYGMAPIPGASPWFDRLSQELDAYFSGALRSFTVPLDTAGTPFQERVWAMLRTIPYGQTRSYGEQARLIDMPTATRAVARANGDNRISIIIPCHRVVGSDGKLTGYGGGLWRKQWLLEMERRKVG
jgi:AraC family transcriptional regulator of adaptative response/methylated-DNA-[protein]-cysteine methyltransferase